MMSFRNSRLKNLSLPTSSVWLLTDIARCHGKQELYTKQAPQALKALREMALIQSAESSNRIEGVVVAAARLKPIVLGHARPKDRSEEEIQGYRNALNLIHLKHADLMIEPAFIRKLHLLIQEGAGDAGQWKKSDNEIVEIVPGQPPRVRFRPTSARKVSPAMEELCRSYSHSITQDHVQPLVAMGSFVLDFLCIHPFRDGNGRTARLLTLLALYQEGMDVGRYISLEKLMEDSKEDYYRVLQESSQRWHEGKHDLLPWLNYFFSIVRRAYLEFEKRAEQSKMVRGAKTRLIQESIKRFVGSFTLSELESACPGVSRDMIKKVLKQLQKEKQVNSLGRGPGARWKKR